MKWKTHTKQILIGTLLLLLFIQLALKARADEFTPLVSTVTSPQVYITTNKAIGFQNDVDTWVIVTITANYLNSSSNNIGITQTGGFIIFQSTQSFTSNIIYSNQTISQVRIDGSAISNGTSHNFDTAQHEIEWLTPASTFPGPLLPMMFIFGMVGLVSMVGSPLYAFISIKNGWRKGDWDGLVMAFIIGAVGFALFIAWLTNPGV